MGRHLDRGPVTDRDVSHSSVRMHELSLTFRRTRCPTVSLRPSFSWRPPRFLLVDRPRLPELEQHTGHCSRVGTFTSVAADDGTAVQWVPRQAPSELPCFVERLQLQIKGYLPGTVRMETPVLYFYAPAPTSVDVGGALSSRPLD